MSNEVYLHMGIEAKGSIEKRETFGDYAWTIEVHHIGPDEISSRTRMSFPTAEAAFFNMVESFSSIVQHLIEDYNS